MHDEGQAVTPRVNGPPCLTGEGYNNTSGKKYVHDHSHIDGMLLSNEAVLDHVSRGLRARPP